MFLNTISSVDGATHKKRRVGRGIGSGLGKTCGRGHKGQKSRAGGFHKVGFEGGQMPLQRRLPKRGFNSRTHSLNAEVRVGELNKLAVDEIDIFVLKQAGLVPERVVNVKVISGGAVEKSITLKGLAITKGARSIIQLAGGKVEE